MHAEASGTGATRRNRSSAEPQMHAEGRSGQNGGGKKKQKQRGTADARRCTQKEEGAGTRAGRRRSEEPQMHADKGREEGATKWQKKTTSGG